MKPIITKREYMKWGFVPTRFQAFICPACNDVLNAGRDYQPRFCAKCGAKLDFTGITFEDDEDLRK